MFDSIPDWIEILFGLLATQIPALWRWRKAKSRSKHERERYVRLGSFEYRSRRKDDDQS